VASVGDCRMAPITLGTEDEDRPGMLRMAPATDGMLACLTSGSVKSVSTAELRAAMRSPLAFSACVMTGTIAALTLALTPPAANVDAPDRAVEAALACCANVASPPPAATAAMPDAPEPLAVVAAADAPAPPTAERSVARVAGVLSDMPAARAVALPRFASGVAGAAVIAVPAEEGGVAAGALGTGVLVAGEDGAVEGDAPLAEAVLADAVAGEVAGALAAPLPDALAGVLVDGLADGLADALADALVGASLDALVGALAEVLADDALADALPAALPVASPVALVGAWAALPAVSAEASGVVPPTALVELAPAAAAGVLAPVPAEATEADSLPDPPATLASPATEAVPAFAGAEAAALVSAPVWAAEGAEAVATPLVAPVAAVVVAVAEPAALLPDAPKPALVAPDPAPAPAPTPATPDAVLAPAEACVPGRFRPPSPEPPGRPALCGRALCELETKPGVCVETPGVRGGVSPDRPPAVGMVLLDAINAPVSGVATHAASAETLAEISAGTPVGTPVDASAGTSADIPADIPAETSAGTSAEVIAAKFVPWSAPVSCTSVSSCAMFAADDAAAPLVASGRLTPCNVAGACASTLPRSTAPDIAPPAAVADDAAFAALLVALAALANNAPALAARDASTVVLGNADSLCAARALA